MLPADDSSLQATIGDAARWLTGPSRAGGHWAAGAVLVSFQEWDGSC